jgi:hypothetical protein
MIFPSEESQSVQSGTAGGPAIWRNPIFCGRADELRAALHVAGKEIRKLNFGRVDTPVLNLLRRALRETRAVAAAEKRNATKGA